MSTKNHIGADDYKRALNNSWDIPLDEENILPIEILTWLSKKSTELGVPKSYLLYPLITSVAYCMGLSEVVVTETYKEPVILYCLVSGRSGTNKSGSLNVMKNLLSAIEGDTDRQHIFDSGTMEGLMGTLKANNGSVMCAVDEFATFLDALDKNSNGNAERSRYLSLWSGIDWSKKRNTEG